MTTNYCVLSWGYYLLSRYARYPSSYPFSFRILKKKNYLYFYFKHEHPLHPCRDRHVAFDWTKGDCKVGELVYNYNTSKWCKNWFSEHLIWLQTGAGVGALFTLVVEFYIWWAVTNNQSWSDRKGGRRRTCAVYARFLAIYARCGLSECYQTLH